MNQAESSKRDVEKTIKLQLRALIVMVTTETEGEQVQRALTAGANEYIMKPFTREVLLDKLMMIGMSVGAS